MFLWLRQPHKVKGAYAGHKLFGIRSIIVVASQLRTSVEQCSKASRSADARDKYFAAYVPEFDPSYGKTLSSEVPALEVSIDYAVQFVPRSLFVYASR